MKLIKVWSSNSFTFLDILATSSGLQLAIQSFKAPGTSTSSELRGLDRELTKGSAQTTTLGNEKIHQRILPPWMKAISGTLLRETLLKFPH